MGLQIMAAYYQVSRIPAHSHKYKQAAKQLCERLHRLSPGSSLDNKIIGQAAGGVKISNMFG